MALVGLASATLTLGGCMSSAASRSTKDSALSMAMQALVDDARYPLAGLSVLCLQAGRPVYEGQWGRRFIAGANGVDLPVTRDTLFRMASVSKLIVALGVMRLVDAGKMSLDGDVADWLGYPLRHPQFPSFPITPRLLLSHRAALSDEGGYRWGPEVSLRSVLSPDGALFAKGKSWLTHAPGSFFQYCNLNFGLLASVVERVSGQRFDRFMRSEVLSPLGMAGGFNPTHFTDDEMGHVATLYRKRSADERWNSQGPWVPQVDDFGGRRPTTPDVPASYVLGANGTLFSPQGGIRTRVQDLGVVVQMLLHEGQYNGRQFLSRHAVQALLSEQWRHDAKTANGDTVQGIFQAWGVGLQHFIDRSVLDGTRGSGDRLQERGGVNAWGHLGDAYGLNSGVVFDFERQSGVIYVISGVSADPQQHRSHYSSFAHWEAQLLDRAWEYVL